MQHTFCIVTLKKKVHNDKQKRFFAYFNVYETKLRRGRGCERFWTTEDKLKVVPEIRQRERKPSAVVDWTDNRTSSKCSDWSHSRQIRGRSFGAKCVKESIWEGTTHQPVLLPLGCCNNPQLSSTYPSDDALARQALAGPM